MSAARAIALAGALAASACAAPWNQSQVTPCLFQCAVTITGPVPVAASPMAVPATERVVVEPGHK